jgi:hypothetical protein
MNFTHAQSQDLEEGYGYLYRLLVAVSPDTQPEATLLGLATQIDNYIAGLTVERNEAIKARDFLSSQNSELLEDIAACRKELEVLRGQHHYCLDQKEALRCAREEQP